LCVLEKTRVESDDNDIYGIMQGMNPDDVTGDYAVNHILNQVVLEELNKEYKSFDLKNGTRHLDGGWKLKITKVESEEGDYRVFIMF